MSQNVKRSFDLKGIAKEGLRLALIGVAVVMALAALSSFLLMATGEPEIYYSALGYVIPVLAAFVTARLFITNGINKIYSSIAFSMVYCLAFIVASLLISSNSSEIKQMLLKYGLIIVFALLGSTMSKGGKKHKKIHKRK